MWRTHSLSWVRTPHPVREDCARGLRATHARGLGHLLLRPDDALILLVTGADPL